MSVKLKEIKGLILKKVDDQDHWGGGYNQALEEQGERELELDLETLTRLISQYHFELGQRMVEDAGKNKKIYPAREMANFIQANLSKLLVARTKGAV